MMESLRLEVLFLPDPGDEKRILSRLRIRVLSYLFMCQICMQGTKPTQATP